MNNSMRQRDREISESTEIERSVNQHVRKRKNIEYIHRIEFYGSKPPRPPKYGCQRFFGSSLLMKRNIQVDTLFRKFRITIISYLANNSVAGQSMDPSAMSEWVNIESSPLANEAGDQSLPAA